MSGIVERFGKNVRRHRLDKGWSQERLADAADLERAYLTHLELGRRNPTLKTAYRIAEALGVDIRLLLEPLATPSETTASS